MSYRVLVVDDEAPVRDLFADLLKAEKCAVKCVANGEEALALVDKEDFDVALLDIKLPGISGIETLKKMKEKKPGLIAIMITGFGYDEGLIAKSKEFGCSGYIGKNMPISQIMSSLKMFINAANQQLKDKKTG
ncbi:MAG: response regulator [Candidatus Omnitrophota bacterium]|jgi:DNA-binding NtrC family response regulator